jgi:hypothetical protein
MPSYRNAIVMLSAAFGFANVAAAFELAYITWVIGLFVLSVPVFIKTLPGSDVLRSPVVVWCFGFAWMSVAWFFLSSQSDVAWQDVRLRFFTILTMVCFLILLWDADAIKFARYAVAAGVLFGLAMNIYELFVPMTFSKLPGRSAGLYGDPNLTGEVLVLGMIVSVTLLPARWRGLFVLATGIGVCLTLSRSGILGWIIASGALMLLRQVRMKELLVTGMLGVGLVAMLLLFRGDEFLTTLERSGTINKDVLERLDWFTDPAGVSDNSSWARKLLVKQAWEKIAERPWIGSGTGTSRDVVFEGTHNQYLAHMQDHGLLGATIVPLLLVAVGWWAQGEAKQLAMIFGAVVMWQSFFTHNLFDHPSRLMLFALMAAVAWASRSPALDRVRVVPVNDGRAPKALAGA